MNARKLFVLLAAFGLTFSMAGGATAQSDSEPVSVTLSDSTEPCAIDIYAVGGSFGSWEYDSSTGGYTNTSGASTIEFYGDVSVYNLKGCDVTISFGGLSNGIDTIDTTNFSAFSHYQGAAVNPASFGDTGVGANFGAPYYDFNYTLNSVPLMSLGTYSGNIDAFVSNTI